MTEDGSITSPNAATTATTSSSSTTTAARTWNCWPKRRTASALDEEHFRQALAQVARNPVRAKLVRRAWRWPWSSAAAHCGAADPTGLLDLAAWRERLAGADWPEQLTQPQDETALARLRRTTARGRPLGSDSFLSKLERALGRPLARRKGGRKPKKHEQSSTKYI